LALLVLCSMFVSWRGAADASRIFAGQRGVLRPVLEGFLVGALIVPIADIAGLIGEAVAAGPTWPTPSHASAEDWFQYLRRVLLYSSILGGGGAAAALFFTGVNRGLLKWAAR